MRLNREFKLTEKIVLLVLAILTLILVYILAVQYPVKSLIDEARSRMGIAETELSTEQIKAEKKEMMLEKIRTAEANNQSTLADYDNLKNVIAFLNGVMQETLSYNLSFREVKIKDYVAERSIDVSFECEGYRAAENIIRNMQRSPYACKVSDLSIAAKSGVGSNVMNSVIDVQCVVKFYEYYNVEKTEENEDQ